MKHYFRKLFIILILLGIFQSGKAISDARLLRFPDINNNLVAFVYAGDIWTVSSSSGGDAFPYYFRKKGLGQLIGTRTWGGLVGISGNARLVDGGNISVPRFGIFDENGEWIIGGIGVYPDIEVVDRPEQPAKGIDPCVEKAVIFTI